ncbi:hypothetical protein PS1_033307 [Malus domestica]
MGSPILLIIPLISSKSTRHIQGQVMLLPKSRLFLTPQVPVAINKDHLQTHLLCLTSQPTVVPQLYELYALSFGQQGCHGPVSKRWPRREQFPAVSTALASGHGCSDNTSSRTNHVPRTIAQSSAEPPSLEGKFNTT